MISAETITHSCVRQRVTHERLTAHETVEYVDKWLQSHTPDVSHAGALFYLGNVATFGGRGGSLSLSRTHTHASRGMKNMHQVVPEPICTTETARMEAAAACVLLLTPDLDVEATWRLFISAAGGRLSELIQRVRPLGPRVFII